MDQGTMQGIGTIFAMIAFSAICLWAFSKRKKKDFDEASRLPFDDGELTALKRDASEHCNKRHN
jgi:cytochrome c oxidase cbb3-type subunit IV